MAGGNISTVTQKAVLEQVLTSSSVNVTMVTLNTTMEDMVKAQTLFVWHPAQQTLTLTIVVYASSHCNVRTVTRVQQTLKGHRVTKCMRIIALTIMMMTISKLTRCVASAAVACKVRRAPTVKVMPEMLMDEDVSIMKSIQNTVMNTILESILMQVAPGTWSILSLVRSGTISLVQVGHNFSHNSLIVNLWAQTSSLK
jgi:hypothetical protein